MSAMDISDLHAFRDLVGDQAARIVGPLTVSPASADHWSGGDDLVKAAIERGEVRYWTVQGHKGMTLCDGRRFTSKAAAEAWILKQIDVTRPRPGRPPLSAGQDTGRLEIKLPADLRDRAKAEADARGITLSRLVREVLTEALGG